MVFYFNLTNLRCNTKDEAWLGKNSSGSECNLLRTTDRTITDVAFASGFSDAAYFSYAFKRTAGCSPLAYRKQ
jgi:YesN/AraC family two-component response regulator